MGGHALFSTTENLFSNNRDGFSFGEGAGYSNREDGDTYFRPLGLDNRLTVSFAPDGTSIFTHTSSLFDSFSGILDASEIENTILRAFKTWAQEGNLDVGVTNDSGAAFGVAGRTYADPRFGDVRIGAFPMASDVYAIALSQGDFVSGTWAGDILFNSNAEFDNADHFYSVALHEIGHSLGLNHSDEPTSIMHPNSSHLQLSAKDIEDFHGLYGVRQLDRHDDDDDDDDGNNNSMESAAELEFDDDVGVPGFVPSIVFGDISDSSDLDYFELEIPEDYQGPVSFRVVSEGISLLAPQLALFNEDGDVIDSQSSKSNRGDVLNLTLAAGDLDEEVFVRVIGANGNESGSYSLITTLDDRLTIDQASIMKVAQDREFTYMDQDDIAEYLADPESYLFQDDDHSDDDHDSSHELETEDGYDRLSRFTISASLVDQSDVDVYSIKSLEFDPQSFGYTMNVSLRSIDVGGMIPITSIFDEDGLEVSSNVVVNGLGEYVIQAANISPDTQYFVHVAADDFLAFQTGNYELAISYFDRSVEFDELASGLIDDVGTSGSPIDKNYHSLHVAQSQMFQFALEADDVPGQENALVWATVYDQTGSVVYQAATRTGERRTANTVYFGPGSYTIEIEVVSDGNSRETIGYRFLGLNVGDGHGPDFNDPTNSPFTQNGNGDYVYPDNVVTSATFVIVDGISSNQTDPPQDDPPTNLYWWYWGLEY